METEAYALGAEGQVFEDHIGSYEYEPLHSTALFTLLRDVPETALKEGWIVRTPGIEKPGSAAEALLYGAKFQWRVIDVPGNCIRPFREKNFSKGGFAMTKAGSQLNWVSLAEKLEKYVLRDVAASLKCGYVKTVRETRTYRITGRAVLEFGPLVNVERISDDLAQTAANNKEYSAGQHLAFSEGKLF